MKTNFILLFISLLSMGGLLLTPEQPSSEAQSTKIMEVCSPVKKSTNTLQKSLDSIEYVRLKKINHYENEIKNSFKVIKKEQKELEEISLLNDSLYSMVTAIDTITVQTDTLKPKKKSWLKKQIDKLKK